MPRLLERQAPLCADQAPPEPPLCDARLVDGRDVGAAHRRRVRAAHRRRVRAANRARQQAEADAVAATMVLLDGRRLWAFGAASWDGDAAGVR